MIGQKFNRLLVVGERVGEKKKWECLCDCGATVFQNKTHLVSGKVKSCGCLNKETRKTRMIGTNSVDHVGARFGRLTVKAKAANRGRKTFHLCLCDCGKEKEVRTSHLTTGAVRSCGCLLEESQSTRSITHGMSNSTEYNVWVGMRRRCGNPNHDAYKNYGGRGIKVCDRWESSFENFFKDMGERPSGKTLDRINNDEGYSPDNCRWATWEQQAANRREPSKPSR